MQETKDALKNCQVSAEKFDSLVCNSGSEMYYPWHGSEIDSDYESHIEYRWPGDNVKSTVLRLVKEVDGDDAIVECEGVKSSRCYSFAIKPGVKVSLLYGCENIYYIAFRCDIN